MIIDEQETPNFINPHYSLQYFPLLAQNHLKRFRAHIDCRRSFIIEYNPFYDSLFVGNLEN